MSTRVRKYLAPAFACIALLALGLPTRAAGISDECKTPSPALDLGATLPHTLTRLVNGRPVKIVAFGSSSTAGAGASDAGHAYPSQLADALGRLFPKSHVAVLNKGVNGEQTADMLSRLDRDVLAEHPDLVIWQSGSNEILAKSDPAVFRRQMLDGLARLKSAGVEVVLMDAQFAPRILENPDYGAFNEALREIAHRGRIAMFDRFEVMRSWLASGKEDEATFVAKDQLHMTDAGYRCVGQLLAHAIASQPSAVAVR
ncbi:MAG TPA: SGNH/GDSL hydrolase family protein [Alphaproteobacteria bacterium]|nr:SGNH/GDSL hydrolase family protein [Alphaproteobacteria bacterium]